LIGFFILTVSLHLGNINNIRWWWSSRNSRRWWINRNYFSVLFESGCCCYFYQDQNHWNTLHLITL